MQTEGNLCKCRTDTHTAYTTVYDASVRSDTTGIDTVIAATLDGET
jgi:hypothetical protein